MEMKINLGELNLEHMVEDIIDGIEEVTAVMGEVFETDRYQNLTDDVIESNEITTEKIAEMIGRKTTEELITELLVERMLLQGMVNIHEEC